jgi:general stress protein YciG
MVFPADKHTRLSNDEEEEKPSGISNRGFAKMVKTNPTRQREIARKGGKSQGKENNPGNFANDPQRAARAGRKGGQA